MFSDKQASHFLFASPDRRDPSSSARRVHLRRLSDILHLSIQRGDLPLARSAFGLLARCEDVEWAAIWKFGLGILAADDPPPLPPGDVLLGTPKHIEFLQVMMLRHPEQVRGALPPFCFFPTVYNNRQLTISITQRELLVRELVLSLAMAGRERDALDELELCGSP
jgi:hypothetical protein